VKFVEILQDSFEKLITAYDCKLVIVFFITDLAVSGEMNKTEDMHQSYK